MGNLTPQKFEPVIDTSADDKISQLLSAMPRVEAPGDFGFRVKARIAEGRPVNSQPLWLPTAIKAAVPLGLVLAIGGYVGVTSFYVTDNNPSEQAVGERVRPVIVQQVPAAPAPESMVPPTVVATVSNDKAVPTSPNREIAAKPASVKRSSPKKHVTNDRDSGSYVISATDAKKPSSAGDDPIADKPEEIKGTPAGEVLTKIGVNALFGEGGWKADSVSPNTAAAKAGVKAGDIIESVDDQDLTDRASVGKPAKGKKLKVKRDGKSVEIVID